MACFVVVKAVRVCRWHINQSNFDYKTPSKNTMLYKGFYKTKDLKNINVNKKRQKYIIKISKLMANS